MMVAPLMAFAAVFAVLCLIGAAFDIRQRRLPNWLSLALLIGGLAFAVTQRSDAWPWHLALAAVCFVGGALLFRFGVFGAGDAKFLTGIAAWFALAAGPSLLTAIGLSGLGLFIAWFVWRRATGRKISRASDSPFEKLPYGVAIASGGMIAGYLTYLA